jgi:hypothetical protein
MTAFAVGNHVRTGQRETRGEMIETFSAGECGEPRQQDQYYQFACYVALYVHYSVLNPWIVTLRKLSESWHLSQ